MTRFVALANIHFSLCDEARRKVEELGADYVLLLGGFAKCWRIVLSWRVLGINALEDDILASKLLRRLGGYVAGKWLEPVKGVFVGGVDGANPVQNLERLLESFPGRPGVYIVLSRYPPCTGTCSRHRDLGLEFCIDELVEVVDRCSSEGPTVVAVGSYMHKACSDTWRGVRLFVVDNSPRRLLVIDVSEGSVDARLAE